MAFGIFQFQLHFIKSISRRRHKELIFGYMVLYDMKGHTSMNHKIKLSVLHITSRVFEL